MGQVELSFVVPAYNEEDFIEDTLGDNRCSYHGQEFALRNCSS